MKVVDWEGKVFYLKQSYWLNFTNPEGKLLRNGILPPQLFTRNQRLFLELKLLYNFNRGVFGPARWSEIFLELS